MYYDSISNDHGLRYDPFKALIAPRPIGWISSLSANGELNLAPYSFFNGICNCPNIVMFSSQMYKDSVRNVDETGEFVCNVASYDLRDQMNVSSGPYSPEIDEFEEAGLATAPSKFVAPPRVRDCPAALECKKLQTIELKDLDGNPANAWTVIGQVVGVYIDDDVIIDGMVDVTRYRPVARLGYSDYSVVNEVFSLTRPQ